MHAAAASATPERDTELVAAVARGDRRAFEELYVSYRHRVARFVLRLAPRHEIAEEVVDDTFWVVWRKAKQFRGDARVSTWIMLGYASLEELRAIGSTDELYPNPEMRRALIEKLKRDGKLVEAEYELKRRDGTVITITENARLNRDERGQPTGFEGTLTDITERKRAEQQFYEEKERAEVTLQSIADAVITTDRAGTVDYINPIAEKMTGWPSDEACGRNVTEIVKLVKDGGREIVDDPVSHVPAARDPARARAPRAGHRALR